MTRHLNKRIKKSEVLNSLFESSIVNILNYSTIIEYIDYICTLFVYSTLK
jgi:hypothetical protein